MGPIIVLPWEDVRDLTGIWLIPLGLIPQGGLHPRLICDYTWSSLNAAILHQVPVKAMQFSWALLHLLHTILNANPRGGPIFMSKIDLVDTT